MFFFNKFGYFNGCWHFNVTWIYADERLDEKNKHIKKQMCREFFSQTNDLQDFIVTRQFFLIRTYLNIFVPQ